MWQALIPMGISMMQGALGGRQTEQQKWTEKQTRELYNQMLPLFRQSVTQQQQRSTQMQPLFDAVLRMVGGGLPNWAGLDLNMLARPQIPTPPEPRHFLQGLHNQRGGH